MRTYCLGAESAEELRAWVRALRRGASALPGSAPSVSQQALQERRGADPPSPPLPSHSPGEGLGGTAVPPPCCPPGPALPHSEVPQAQEEPPARGCPPGAGDTPGGPRGPPEPEPAARSPRKPRPPGAAPPERDIGTNQPPASPAASSDWLPSAAEPAGTAPAAASNEASRRRREVAGGRGRAREGVAGRPIRITLLQASF
ncbi:proline-rich protein 2-like [Passer montanus]|uniref:proline-rich protein 2-like n=1 Tax=Passer montanus TaxID=9160 RepID=UPI00195FEAAD|nr:proline-rich protein 2-like [Passer montanus]